MSQSSERAGERVAKRIYSWAAAREVGRRHAKASGPRANGQGPFLPPSFLKEERDSTVFVASPREGLARSALPEVVLTP